MFISLFCIWCTQITAKGQQPQNELLTAITIDTKDYKYKSWTLDLISDRKRSEEEIRQELEHRQEIERLRNDPLNYDNEQRLDILLALDEQRQQQRHEERAVGSIRSFCNWWQQLGVSYIAPHLYSQFYTDKKIVVHVLWYLSRFCAYKGKLNTQKSASERRNQENFSHLPLLITARCQLYCSSSLFNHSDFLEVEFPEISFKEKKPGQLVPFALSNNKVSVV